MQLSFGAVFCLRTLNPTTEFLKNTSLYVSVVFFFNLPRDIVSQMPLAVWFGHFFSSRHISPSFRSVSIEHSF